MVAGCPGVTPGAPLVPPASGFVCVGGIFVGAGATASLFLVVVSTEKGSVNTGAVAVGPSDFFAGCGAERELAGSTNGARVFCWGAGVCDGLGAAPDGPEPPGGFYGA